jgi:hypothetical protein
MARPLGLARVICNGCNAEQLVLVRDILADATIECPGCGQQESAASVVGRDGELARLVGLMRELHRMSAGRGEGGTSSRPTAAERGKKERV